MHDTALSFAKHFFDTYTNTSDQLTIVDIGAQDINGSLRSVAPETAKYIGVDFVAGKGVDIIITDPYTLPIEDESIDICVCSSCFEHSEFFWLLYIEVLRILKPNGLFYLNVPSNGSFHRHPVDCWRFYPDSGIALQNWAQRCGYNSILLESFTGEQKGDIWNDFVAVFLKDEKNVSQHGQRIQEKITNYSNGLRYGQTEISRRSQTTEDGEKIEKYKQAYWEELNSRRFFRRIDRFWETLQKMAGFK